MSGNSGGTSRVRLCCPNKQTFKYKSSLFANLTPGVETY